MAKYLRFFVSAAVLAIALISGCSDRGTNYEPTDIIEGGILVKTHSFDDALLMQIRNEFQIMPLTMYVPDVSIPYITGPEPKQIPMLVLLPPQDGDQYFYFNHGLRRVADELIASGEIEPMAVACISNDWVFGGYWFAGNYPPGGKYDDLIGGDLIGFLYDSCFIYGINDPSQRGIGGIGQGAYGALRAAIKHPGTFSSISVVDGPLDFDGGAGHGTGLIGLMDSVFTFEQPGLTDDDTFRSGFDSSSTHPISRLFIGGSVAFSPNDTALDLEIEYLEDSITRRITIVGRHEIQDTISLIDHIVRADANDFDFHLPFTWSQRPYEPIWNMWIDDNLENLMTGGEFIGVDLWVGTSPETRFGFHQQTMSFVQTLQDNGYSPSVKTYTGYDGFPASSSQYVYELLRDMLIFHSNNFQSNN